MSAIKKVENLSQAHLDYIILALSKTSDLEEVKQSFQDFFETGVSGEVLMKVFSSNHSKVAELKDKIPYAEKTKGIRIADPIEQQKLLDALYDLCLRPEVVNVTREGEPIMKIDKATALRCIEVSAKIRNAEMTIEIKRQELASLNGSSDNTTAIEGEVTSTNTGPIVRIINKKSSDGV